MEWKAYLSLKWQVILIFVVLWNTGFLLAMYSPANGIELFFRNESKPVLCTTLIAASIFSFSVAILEPVQRAFVATSRAHNFRTKEFYFLGLLALVMSVAFFFTNFSVASYAH